MTTLRYGAPRAKFAKPLSVRFDVAEHSDSLDAR
jgi:hypothetical protein